MSQMIFEPERRLPVPSKDLISYVFDDPSYPQDKKLYIDAHDPSRALTYGQVRTVVRQLIAGLRAGGVKKGDCVVIHAFNDIYYTMLVLAIVGAGGVYTGTNPAYTAAEIAHHLRASQATFVISEPEILDPFLEAAKEVGIPQSHFWVFDTQKDQTVPAGMRSWREFLKHGEQDWVRFDDLSVSSTTTACRLFSSGTTGLPKAVTLTHANLVAQHEFVWMAYPRPYDMVRLVATPVFHAAAAPLTHFGAIKSGCVMYVMRRFDLKEYLEATINYGVTDCTMVPPIAIAVLMSPITSQKPYLKGVRSGICGAAPLDKDVQARLRKLMVDDAPFTQVWGMTETSCVATLFPYPEHDDTGAVGRLIPNVEAKLIDLEGKNISAYGVRGEMCVRGPTITPGYFNNEAANKEAFDSEGWFKTGDIMYCDEATKKWYVVDRKKELIKVRGFQVAPPELEAALLSHPLIVDAAVIGVPASTARDGEMPRAYVVRRPDSEEAKKLTEEEVVRYMGSRLARYKALTGGVKFVDAITKNASGKILKRVLREEYKKEMEAKAGGKAKL